MAKAKQATTKSWWVKKHIFLWSDSSCYRPESVFTHVTASSLMGFSGTRRKAHGLWKRRYVFSPPADQIERTLGVTAGADLGVFKCFQPLPLLLLSCITDFSLSKAAQRNRIQKLSTERVKVTQFYHSWWVFFFSSRSSFTQKRMHIIFTLGVSASLVLLFRQLTGCKPAVQNQTLPFILGFALIILSWISYFFISYYFMPCLLLFKFFFPFLC